MLCRAVCIALILASCASLSEAENRNDVFRVPDPEEISEAYRDGFIEYRDYRELLEITRREFLSPADTVFLMQFPDLMAGLSSHPLIESGIADMAEVSDTGGTTAPSWRHAALFRQYHRLEDETACRRLYRFEGDYQRVQVYGEYEREYSGRRNWYRRSLAYSVDAGSGSRYSVVLGNFKDRFGMGLIYGYHGRMLPTSTDASGSESLLYPDYGGSNGVYASADRGAQRYRFVFDSDRDRSFETRLTAMSVSRHMTTWDIAASVGRGQINNRTTGAEITFSVFSLWTRLEQNGLVLSSEVAAADDNGRWPLAGMAQMILRRGWLRLRMDTWSYGGGYPSFFSGGPSSRRSRTVELAEIGFSYSDRYRGEQGIVISSGYPVINGVTMHSSMMYASRGLDDDRLEARLGLDRRISPTLRLGIDGYWRGDGLYSNRLIRRRLQLELVHSYEGVRSRFVIGRRFDIDPDRHDYMVMISTRVRNRWGTASALAKVDRMTPGDWAGRYLYATAQYELRLSASVSTYIKYSHRYLRDDPAGSYGIFRWDVKWVIQ